jgi:Flp pilus assembly protein TadG
MAFILPVFVSLVLGGIEFARLGMVSSVLTNAAREGCRSAVIFGSTQAGVSATVTDLLNRAKVNRATITIGPSGWESAVKGSPITVTVSVPFAQVSWLPMPRWLGKATVVGVATMSSERP